MSSSSLRERKKSQNKNTKTNVLEPFTIWSVKSLYIWARLQGTHFVHTQTVSVKKKNDCLFHTCTCKRVRQPFCPENDQENSGSENFQFTIFFYLYSVSNVPLCLVWSYSSWHLLRAGADRGWGSLSPTVLRGIHKALRPMGGWVSERAFWSLWWQMHRKTH